MATKDSPQIYTEGRRDFAFYIDYFNLGLQRCYELIFPLWGYLALEGCKVFALFPPFFPPPPLGVVDRPRMAGFRLVDWCTPRPTRRALKTRSCAGLHT